MEISVYFAIIGASCKLASDEKQKAEAYCVTWNQLHANGPRAEVREQTVLIE